MNSRKIQLLIATGLYPPDIGGPATYACMLEEKLPAHNVVITVVPFGTVRHLPKIVRHIVYTWKLLKVVRGKDVVYALDPISVGIPARLVAFLTRTPFIIRLGGDYAWEQGQQRFGLTQTLDAYTENPHKVPLTVRILAWIQTKIVQSALFVVLPSEYLKSIVVRWTVSPSKIRVMYSSLFPLSVTGSKESLRTQLGFEGPVIVSVGRLVPWKGFMELIQAVAQLVPDIPNIKLVIVGDGPMHEDLVAQAASCGISEHVTLVGRQNKTELGITIKSSDVFVLNTAYEGLSHQLLEVMDLGVPIITTRVGGNPELITDGVSGVLVEVGDTEGLSKAIKHVLTNEHAQVRLIQHARLRTQDFSQDAVVTKVAAFLHQEVVIK